MHCIAAATGVSIAPEPPGISRSRFDGLLTLYMERIAQKGVLFASAVREVWRQGYSATDLRHDLIAGLTVGIVAVPLSMALAIASGVPPQHGLYTAIIAGALIAVTGGSRINVSGPTAAFVVILLPVTQQFGVGGLLLATLMAGVILIAMGIGRMGQLIQFIPYPVTTGFTAGIAVVIATLQLRDFFGLQIARPGGHFIDKTVAIVQAMPTLQWADLSIAVLTLSVLLLWPRLKLPVPAHLMALVVGTLAGWMGTHWIPGFEVATIGSRFHYLIDGVAGQGIAPMAPMPLLPWHLPGPDGKPLALTFGLVRELIGPAFAIAMLGAIESLLCSVVADGLSGYKHNPNAELIGQGLGNIVAPFFGGITATSAIARTATNVRSGGRTPVAAVVHALVVLLSVLLFASLLNDVPMAALAAFLMVVAWNMSEAKHFIHILRVAPRSDVAVLLVCFSLTVLFDMVVAVGIGVVLAALLFIRRMSDLSGSQLLESRGHERQLDLPEEVAVYAIRGPLFFGAAEKAMGVLQRVQGNVQVVIIDMSDVPMMDMTGMVALDSLLSRLARGGISVVISNLSPRIRKLLDRAGINAGERLHFCNDLQQAREQALSLVDQPSALDQG